MSELAEAAVGDAFGTYIMRKEFLYKTETKRGGGKNFRDSRLYNITVIFLS